MTKVSKGPLEWKTMGITGNRPQKLPGYLLPQIKQRVTEAVDNFAAKGGERVIAGGALGVDTWAAEAALAAGLDLWLYLPFPDQDKDWAEEDRRHFRELKAQAKKVEYTGDRKDVSYYHERNRRIVDACDVLFSLHRTGEYNGGAYNATKYAKEQARKPVLEVLVDEERLSNNFHRGRA